MYTILGLQIIKNISDDKLKVCFSFSPISPPNLGFDLDKIATRFFCCNYLKNPSLTTYQKGRKKEVVEVMLICINTKWPLLPIFWL